mgnify:CR=1 FL=1
MFQNNPDLAITVDSPDTKGSAFSTENADTYAYELSQNYALIEAQLDTFQDLLAQTVAARDSALDAETAAELAQSLSEAAQALSETAQGLSEDAQAASEAAQALAESAQIAAETAKDNAVIAQGAAETAQNESESARDTTLFYRDEANDYASDAEKLAINPEDNQYTLSDGTTTGYSALHYSLKAEDSKDAAATSASEALTSENNAATSASEASDSATEAATSETNAATSEANALASEQAAATSETNAATSETNAATSETNASASALAASTSETNAATSETNAAASALAASTSETNAATSETNASTSETNALASESAAATSETNAATSASNALTSENNAATSETNAATSASNALTSETNSATSETNAATSETNASTSESNALNSANSAASARIAAETARDQTLTAYDNFDDRYLGAKASDPSVDNDGNALVGGALYFDTTNEVMKVYTGSIWANAYSSLDGALLVANNLSDLDNASTARTNLGLGTAATTNSTAYATAAQGANADTAFGWGDHNTEGYLTSYTETDPIFSASEAASITSTDTGNWDTAYGWGDHSTEGYLLSSDLIATDTSYDNTESGLVASNVQSAIDEIQEKKLNISDLAANVVFYPTDSNSDILTYFKLVSSTDDVDYDDTAVDISTGTITTTDQFIAALASETGILSGSTGVLNITTVGNVRRVSGFGQADFYFEVYKRDSGNTETLMGTSNSTREVSQNTYEQFVAECLISSTSFTETDRIVFKYYGNNTGGFGDSEFEFQFGGDAPVRSNLPVPVNVVSHANDAEDILVDTSSFSGILSGSDDDVQAALNTLDSHNHDNDYATEAYADNTALALSIALG